MPWWRNWQTPLHPPLADFAGHARWGLWRNWYTRMLEVHVPQGVEVQVLSSAPCRGSSVVERGSEEPSVGSSILSLGTTKHYEPRPRILRRSKSFHRKGWKSPRYFLLRRSRLSWGQDTNWRIEYYRFT